MLFVAVTPDIVKAKPALQLHGAAVHQQELQPRGRMCPVFLAHSTLMELIRGLAHTCHAEFIGSEAQTDAVHL